MRVIFLLLLATIAVTAVDLRRQYATQGSLLAEGTMCPGTGTCCTGPHGASVCPHVGGVCCADSGFCCPASFGCHMFNGQASCVKAQGVIGGANGAAALSQPLFNQAAAAPQGAPSGQYMVVEKRPDGTVVTTITKTHAAPACGETQCDGDEQASGAADNSGGSDSTSDSGSGSAASSINSEQKAEEKHMTSAQKSAELKAAAAKDPKGPPPPAPSGGNGGSAGDDKNAPPGGPSTGGASDSNAGSAGIPSEGSKTKEEVPPNEKSGIDPAVAKAVAKQDKQARAALGLKKGDRLRKDQKDQAKLSPGTSKPLSSASSDSTESDSSRSRRARHPIRNHLKLNSKVEITLGEPKKEASSSSSSSSSSASA